MKMCLRDKARSTSHKASQTLLRCSPKCNPQVIAPADCNQTNITLDLLLYDEEFEGVQPDLSPQRSKLCL